LEPFIDFSRLEYVFVIDPASDSQGLSLDEEGGE
jgi:hypothetical protein